MPLWAEFCGGSYQARSPSIAADQAINVYVETREVEGSPKQKTLYGTPGLNLQTTAPTPVNRGWFSQDGQTWTVVGDQLYPFDTETNTTGASLGTIVNDGFPVSFASNGQGGNQLAIVGGGNLYVLNLSTAVFAGVALPFSDPVMIVFQDGYGLINQATTPIVWFSGIEDLLSWDALDFFTRSATSDNVVALGVAKDRVWVFGSATTTLYYDSGDTDTPWVPYPGTTMQVGIVVPWVLKVYNDTFFWIARSPKGEVRVVQASDAMPVTVSTPPIQQVLATSPTLDEAEALLYEQEGHIFYLFTVPSSTNDVQTYGYDLLEKLWHARAGWDEIGGVYTRWRARGCVAVGQSIYVGDYQTGALYTLDLNTYLDNGVTLPRERYAPYASAENQWAFLDEVELGTQPGVGLVSGQGSDPQVELLISRDSAQTWISAGYAPLGALGAYLTRTIWRRLGRVRMDRLVIRIRQTDPVKCVWGPGVWLRFSIGSGQL